MIRIVYLIDSINTVAGTEKQLLSMIERLDSSRYEVHLMCLRKPSATDIDSAQLPFSYHELGLSKLASLQTLRRIRWLVGYFRDHQINIVQTYFFDATVIGVTAAKIAGIECIISTRRDLGFWYTPRLLRVLFVLNRLTTRIQVNSLAVRDNVVGYEKVPCSKIDIIKNGIDCDFFDRLTTDNVLAGNIGIPDGNFIVGIAANLNRPVKRVDVFIRAAAVVAEKVPDVSFVVMGDGYLMENYKNIAFSLGLRTRVFFVGRKDDPARYVNLWDVAVLSSDSEGLSNAILEYMAAGVPVVATSVGGNCEVIKNGVNGILVPAGDHESMATAICDLLDDEQKRDRIATAALVDVRREFDWNNRIGEVDTCYTTLLKD